MLIKRVGDVVKNIKVGLFIILFLLFGGLIYGQNTAIKFIPEKPKAGEEITVVYNPAGTPLEKADSVKLIYSLYSRKCLNCIGSA